MKLTDNELNELKYHYVDRVVDNMSTKDLVQYVFDDMLRHIENIPEVEFFEEGYNYWEDYFDEIVEDFKGGQSENNLNQELIMTKTIVHYGIRVTWSDGEKQWLDDIPDFKDIENYLDVLEEEENL